MASARSCSRAEEQLPNQSIWSSHTDSILFNSFFTLASFNLKLKPLEFSGYRKSLNKTKKTRQTLSQTCSGSILPDPQYSILFNALLTCQSANLPICLPTCLPTIAPAPQLKRKLNDVLTVLPSERHWTSELSYWTYPHRRQSYAYLLGLISIAHTRFFHY